jgi:transposase-like protein
MKQVDRDIQVSGMYEAGSTIKEIAEYSGIAPGTVWNILNRLNVPRRPAARRPAAVPYAIARKKQPRFTAEQHAEMVHLYTNVNKTLEELGMIYGCSKNSISTWLKRANVTFRAPSRRRTSVGYIPNPRAPIISAERIADAAEDRKSGLSWRELSLHYNVSVSYIRRKVLEYLEK